MLSTLVGVDASTVNAPLNVDVPPPGPGFVTLTSRVPIAPVLLIEILTTIKELIGKSCVLTVMSGPKLVVVTP